MKRSRNEIAAMALKAARGAGLPLGLAEDFARAVEVMQTSELAAADLMSDLPRRVPSLIDAARAGEPAVPGQLADDPLLRAYLRRAAMDVGVVIELQDGALRIVAGPAPLPEPEPEPEPGPLAVPPDLWSVWETLAARTYVPASDSSRLAGAGAGLSDND